MTKEDFKSIRLEAGLTQAQLSDFFGLSGKSRIEAQNERENLSFPV